MKELKQYFELQDAIFQYFGYEEDWRAIPLSDDTDEYWALVQEENGKGSVVMSKKPLTVELVEAGAEIFGNSIYTQRFLPKWVYRGPDYTMVCCDTHTDGNKFLRVFSNARECHDDAVKKAYVENYDLYGDHRSSKPVDVIGVPPQVVVINGKSPQEVAEEIRSGR